MKGSLIESGIHSDRERTCLKEVLCLVRNKTLPVKSLIGGGDEVEQKRLLHHLDFLRRLPRPSKVSPCRSCDPCVKECERLKLSRTPMPPAVPPLRVPAATLRGCEADKFNKADKVVA